MLNTQPYGGGLWHTWFDRDLGVAGRVIVRKEDGGLESRLVRIDEPIARIPNLAIHLTAGAEREHFAPNLHEHGKAILTIDPDAVAFKFEEKLDTEARLHPFLLKLVASQAMVEPESVVDMELQLIDTQPSTIGGASRELIFSGRLDNLCSAYQCLRAVIDAAVDSIDSQSNISMAMLFDHEEVGSSSCNGAGSPIFMDTLRTINQVLAGGSHSKFEQCFMRSRLI